VKGANIVEMSKRKRHVDCFALVDSKQSQVVDGDDDTHVATLITFCCKSQLFFVAPDVQIGAELLELAYNIREGGRRQ